MSLACLGQANETDTANPNNKKLLVSFVIDDSSINISNQFKMFFINEKDTLRIGVEGNRLILPNLEKDTGYTIVFMFKHYVLSFNRMTKKLITPDQDITWKFGIDNPPFNDLLGLISNEEYKTNKKIKQIQYFQFDLMEYGDGIQFVHKIE
jgi:hypothetical protein